MDKKKMINLERKRVTHMNTINPKKFGLSIGATFAMLYTACMIVIMTVGKEGVVFLFNTIFHGIDVTSLIRTTMPWYNMAIGLIEIFIIGWLLGATIASIYNFGIKNEK